jgi:ankyrin repeat protein
MPTSPGPPSNKIRLDVDSESTLQQPRILYDRPLAQGNAQVHNGNTQNTFNGPVHYAPSGVAGPVEMGPRTAPSLMEALKFDQMDTHLQTISTAHAKTCQWLFAREEYKTWRDPGALRIHNGFFWIKGKPGAGKSTLMKSALRYGEKAHEDIKISFFFNARGVELERSLEGMYRSLLYQLLEQLPHLSAALPKRREHANRQAWYIEVLREMFEAAILALGTAQVTCYVDALDECDDSEARAMVEAFEVFGTSAVEAQIGFRVLLSSRRYPHITIENCQELDLAGQEGHEADIADYVRCKLKIGKSKIASEIRTAIQTRASGVFLWVVLVIRILNECDARGKTHLLKRRLETIPDGLSELFDEILQRDTHGSDEVLLIFQWILFAWWPLTPEELYFAITTNSSDDNIGEWNRNEITTDDMERYLLDASKGLAEMTKGDFDGIPRVQFIHESVKEYLLSTGLETLQPNVCDDLIASSHDRLGKCCRHYMEKSAAALTLSDADGMKIHMRGIYPSMKTLRDWDAATHPFLCYALHGIIYHANLAHLSDARHDAFTEQFPHTLWRKYYNMRCKLHKKRLNRLNDQSSLVQAFALMGALNLVEVEIRKLPSLVTETTIMKQEDNISLLHIATGKSDRSMLNLLLEHGADVNAPGVEYPTLTCLRKAILRGSLSMVQALLDAGADPTSHLQCALLEYRCSQDMIETMLTHGPFSHPTYWSAELSAALYHARYRTYTVVEKLLSERLATVTDELASSNEEVMAHSHGHAFGAVCSYGNMDMFEVFIKHGILHHSSLVVAAFFKAAYFGHEEIVRQLLDHGVEVDQWFEHKQDTAMSALGVASGQGHGDIVSLLLDRKAYVNHISSVYGTALYAAAEGSHSHTVQLLLDSGADPNIRGECHTTALHVACKFTNEEIVRILLGHVDTDAGALDGDGNHAILLAAHGKNVGIVRALLEREVPLVHVEKASAAAMYYDGYAGRDEIIDMLLAEELSQSVRISIGDNLPTEDWDLSFRRPGLELSSPPSYGNMMFVLL